MKANNSLRINMPRALELIFFFFLGHGPTYPISDSSGSAITRGNCNAVDANQQHNSVYDKLIIADKACKKCFLLKTQLVSHGRYRFH